jgi:hypothetical protein
MAIRGHVVIAGFLLFDCEQIGDLNLYRSVSFANGLTKLRLLSRNPPAL